MCEHHYIHTSHSRVCDRCGVEMRVLRLDTFNIFSAPLCKGYQRVVRFRQKIDKLLYLQNAPSANCLVWEYLNGKTLHNPGDVRKSLRNYSGKNKHYDSVRLFTRAFTSFRVCLKHSPDKLKAIMTQSFSSIIRLWNRYNVTDEMSFFSYDFLLRYFLQKLKSPLIVYCKPVTCHKRHLRNHERLKLILALDDDGRCCQNSAVTRFPSEKRSSASPPYPHKSGVFREAVVWGLDATSRDIRPLNG